MLCGVTCPCNADRSKWNNRFAPEIVAEPPHGRDNITQCTGFDVFLQSESSAPSKTNSSSEMAQGLRILGAMEQDLQCAAMCIPQTNIYLFSYVKNGMPPRNCSSAIIKYMNKTATFTAVWFWIFGVIELLAFIFMVVYACRKIDEGEYKSLIEKHQ